MVMFVAKEGGKPMNSMNIQGTSALNPKKEIIKINALKSEMAKLRVAGYARVSSDSADQLNSFSTQVNYYQRIINTNPMWQMTEVYADEGISGVSVNKRDDFARLIADCRRGKIDRIITKSTSRFARNTLDAIGVIRELKDIGVTVYFEKENLDTATLTSENLLTLYSLFAQEESMTISKNCKKGARMRMSKGTYVSSNPPYGYRLANNQLVIDESEAEIVRRIFSEYLGGKGYSAIARDLMADGIPFKNNKMKWRPQTVGIILKNERYVGDMLLQKSFSEDALPYNKRINKGELPQYYVSNTHEPIVERIQFELAKILREERRENINTDYKEYPLSKKIKCAECGTTYRRKETNNTVYWVCRQHDDSKELCGGQRLLEEKIYSAFVRMYNKLSKNYGNILIPLLTQLEKLQDLRTRNNPEIGTLNKQIAELAEQNHVMNGLLSKGILDSALFISQTDELQKKIRKLKSAKLKLLEEQDADDTIDKTEDLIDILESGPDKITEFNEELLNELVAKVIAYDDKNIDFELINGLVLKERL
ncbi:MAG: recombinase family protein [Clostridia bacterium]|nr:recombinase family protein [Clostridia bacterium]